MSIRLPWVGLAVAAAAAFVLASVQLQPPTLHGPLQRSGALASLNWAGLAQAGATHSFDSVAASWTVPEVRCERAETTYSIAWVGLDGYGGSRTVEQVGTESSCYAGVPTYDAWYELYPAAPVFLNSLAVHAGDRVSASMRYERGGFAIHVDVDGQSFDTVQEASSTTRASAEFAVEAPVSGASVVDFAHVGPVAFGGLAVNGRPASTGAMDVIDMVSASGEPLARTALTDGGFLVRRLS